LPGDITVCHERGIPELSKAVDARRPTTKMLPLAGVVVGGAGECNEHIRTKLLKIGRREITDAVERGVR
jgi:hypothetical protein